MQHDAQWRARLAAGYLSTTHHGATGWLLGLGVLLIVGICATDSRDSRGDSYRASCWCHKRLHPAPLPVPRVVVRRVRGATALVVATIARGTIQPSVSALVESYGSECSVRGLSLRQWR